MRDKLRWIAGVLAIACCAPSFAQDEDFLIPVHYTVRVPDENPLRRFADRSFPCAATLTLRANKLPVNIPSVDVDWVYELDEKGRIKTAWPTPIEATPLAITGNRLLVQQFEEAEEEFVFVTPEGDIGTPLSGPPEVPTLDEDGYKNRVACPTDSDQWDMCSKLVDAATGSVRTIAYYSHCT